MKAKDTMEKVRDEAMKARAEAEKVKEQIEQEAYEMGVVEIKTNLKA